MDYSAENALPIDSYLHAFSSTSQNATNTNLGTEEVTSNRGIAMLPVTYATHKQHVEKGKAIIDFEREGSCSICSEDLIHDKGIYAICPHLVCETVSHLTCLSTNFLEGEAGQRSSSGELNNTDQSPALLPIAGKCKGCGSTVKWVDVVKEVTLRMRGAKEVEGLLKEPRRKARKKPTPSKRKLKDAIAVTNMRASSDTDEGQIDGTDDDAAEDLDDLRDVDPHDEREDFDVTKDDARFATREGSGYEQEEWLDIDNSDDDGLEPVTDALLASLDRAGQQRPITMNFPNRDQRLG